MSMKEYLSILCTTQSKKINEELYKYFSVHLKYLIKNKLAYHQNPINKTQIAGKY